MDDAPEEPLTLNDTAPADPSKALTDMLDGLPMVITQAMRPVLEGLPTPRINAVTAAVDTAVRSAIAKAREAAP